MGVPERCWVWQRVSDGKIGVAIERGTADAIRDGGGWVFFEEYVPTASRGVVARCQHCPCAADERSFMCEDCAAKADEELDNLRSEVVALRRRLEERS